jgi:hypothetical protein
MAGRNINQLTKRSVREKLGDRVAQRRAELVRVSRSEQPL